MYEYRVIVNRWVDGDTVDVDIDLGFGVWLKDQRVKLYGITTSAKDYCVRFCPEGETAVLKTKSYDDKGKHGHILGEIWSDKEYADQSLNDYLIEKGHAVRYYGGKR